MDPDYAEWLAAQGAVGPQQDPDLLEWQAAQGAQQSFGSKMFDALARGGSSLFSSGGSLMDLLQGRPIANQIAQAITGEAPQESPAEQLARLTEERVPKPTSDDPLERYALAATETAPFALAGPIGWEGLASALLAGAGGELAREVGAPEWAGQIAGGLTPAAASGLARTVARPFLPSGQRIIAGQSLLANAGDEGAARLLSNLDDAASYAEIANTPSASAYQQAMRKIPSEGANIMEAALSGEPKKQALSILQELAPDAFSGTPASVRGQALQQGILSSADDAWAAAGDIYKALPNADDTIIPLGKANKAVSESFTSIFGKSKLKPDTDLVRIIDGVSEAPTKTLSEITALQSDVGATISKIARSNPKAKELPVLYKIKEEITTAIDDAVKSGVGLSEKQVAAFNAAKANYAKTGARFGTPLVKSVTKRGPFGSLEAGAPASTIVPKIIARPESAKQFMRAVGDNKELVEQARAGLLDSMPKEFESWAGYFTKKKEVFKELFGDSFPEVEKIMKSIERRNTAASLASKASARQSGTAQFQSAVQKLVTNGPRAIMKSLGTGTGQGAAGITGYAIGNLPGAAAGAALSRVARWAEDNIELLIQKGMVDPALRKAMLAEATRANQRNLMQKLLPLAAIIMKDSGDPVISDKTIERLSEPAVDVDRLVSAIIGQESGGKADAVGYETPETKRQGARALGLMQIMPATAVDIAKELGVKEYDLFDPETNVRFGRHYIQKLLKQFNNDPELALTAYHSGPGTVSKLLKETGGTRLKDIIGKLGPVGQKYAKEVLARYV